jgi:hypothetical protein
MAKRERVTAREVRSGKSTGAKVEAFAEDLGRLLGAARAKAEGWLGQRKTIAKHLENVRDTAANLLSQLTGGGSRGGERGRRGRPARARGGRTARRGPGRPAATVRKKRKMSAEARARIAAAQKARWAKVRAQKKR